MAIDRDDSISLPQPPPPRPAARKAAIDAALRKFDGIEDTTPRSATGVPAQKWWTGMHRRPAGALVTAVAIAVVSVPVALITLRDQPQDMAAPVRESAPARPKQVAIPAAAPPPPQVQADESAVTEEPARPRSIPLPLAPHTDEGASAANVEVVARQAPAPAIAAAPPPPPPPPAPAPERTEELASVESTQDVAVTGSRIRAPNMSKQSDARAVAERDGEPDDAAAAYRRFLSNLQAAVRAGNKRAVANLAALPLRVNFESGSRSYSNRSAIQRDYDRIFTPGVKRAILDHRSDRIFSNWRGAMIGNGEVWFDQICLNDSCSPPGPVRITAVNP